MALGKQIGTFSLKSTSLTYGADGTGHINYEGTVEGEGLTGPVLGTLHIAALLRGRGKVAAPTSGAFVQSSPSRMGALS